MAQKMDVDLGRFLYNLPVFKGVAVPPFVRQQLGIPSPVSPPEKLEVEAIDLGLFN